MSAPGAGGTSGPSGLGDAALRGVFERVRAIAVVGASPNPARPSHGVMGFLIARGYDCVAVNPGHAGGAILGRPCYGALADVPHAFDMVDVFRRPEAVPGVVEEVLALAPRPGVLWLQLGVTHPAAEARARKAGLLVVADRCPRIEHPRVTAA